MEEDGDDDYWAGLAEKRRSDAAIVVSSLVTSVVVLYQQFVEDDGVDHDPPPKRQRSARRQFDYKAAHRGIQRDFVGPDALFGKEFHLFFRLSRTRVQRLMEDLAHTGDPFYRTFRVDMCGRVGACMEVKILLPLRCLAYGDAPHCFCSCFQVSVAHAKEIYNRFLAKVYRVYKDEYLRLPTSADLKSVTNLHKAVHGVPGMIGSLDCMQTKWKNCPIEWQGCFKGQSKGMSTIVLEAGCDHHLWFWHMSYGYPGSLNDVNVLESSPLLERLIDGSFVRTERDSGVVPFHIEGTRQPFDHTYFLCDGIYPRYSRFIKTIKPAIGEADKNFAMWQEGARKDIERAFGVLQCRWKAMTYPIQRSDLEGACSLTACCLIMHNMCVEDRVMGEGSRQRYDPAKDLVAGAAVLVEDAAVFPPGFGRNLYNNNGPPPVQVLIENFDQDIALEVVRNIETAALEDEVEWQRLQLALKRFIARKHRQAMANRPALEDLPVDVE